MIEDMKTIKEIFLKLDSNKKAELLTEFIQLFIDDKEEEQANKIFQAQNWINLLSNNLKNNYSINLINSVCKKRKVTTFTKNKKFLTFGDDLNSLNYFKNRMEHNEGIKLIQIVTCEDEILIASVSTDNIIKIWSSITGENKFTSEVQRGELNCLINIEGNNFMATTFWDENKIQLWDLKERRLFKSIETGQKNPIKIFSLTHKVEKMIMSYSNYYNLIKFWDGDSGEFIKQIDNEEKSFSIIKINKNQLKDKILIACGMDKMIKIWNVDDEQILHTFKCKDHVSNILKNFVVSDSNLLFSGSQNGEILVFDIDNLNLIRTVKGHSKRISSILFLNNNLILSSNESESVIKISNLFDEDYIGEINTEENGVKSMIDVSIEKSKRIAVIFTEQNIIRIFDVDSKKELIKLDRHLDEVTSIIKVPNNFNRNIIASSSSDRNIRIWDITDDTVKYLNHLKYNVKKIFVSESEMLIKIILIFEDNFIHVWDYNYIKNQFRLINVIETKFKNSDFVLINEDKNFVVISSKKIIKIFNLKNSEYFTFEGNDENIEHLVSIKTLIKEMLITVDEKGSIKLWDWKDGKCIHTIECNSNRFNCVITVSNPDRNMIVISENGQPFLVFNADEGILTRKIENDRLIYSLCDVRIKGKSLFASIDHNEGIIKIWNAENGECHSICFSDRLFNFSQYMNYNNLNLLVLGDVEGQNLILNLDTFEEFKKFNTGNQIIMKYVELNKFGNKEIIIGKYDNKLKLYDALSLNCLGEIERNNEALSDYYASPNLIENKRQIMILGWKYGVIKVNLISYMEQIETERGYKNYLCHGPVFN